MVNSTPAFIGGEKDGLRKVNRMGRVGCRKTWTFAPSATGTYKWGVQAIDAAYTGSTFTEGPAFTISSEEDGIEEVQQSNETNEAYDLSGKRVAKTSHLIYIKDGRKTLK